MGNKVIILAGAPDAASLDWSGLLDDGSRGSAETEAVWQHGDGGIHNLISPGHAQWQRVPLRAARDTQSETSQGGAGGENNVELEEAEQVQLQVQQEWAEQASYGRAEFATFTASGYSQSQQRDWSVSSAEVPSLSVYIPGALPPPGPEQQRDLQHPTSSTSSFFLSGETAASQELIEHSLAVHDALLSSLPDPSGFSRGVTYGEGEGDAHAEVAAVDRSGPQLQPQQPQVQRYVPASLSFDTTSSTASFDNTTSLSTGTTGSFAADLARVPPPLPATIPRWQPLTHLVDIPSADALAHLARRHAVTVNIVAAVVAASAPREVSVRQSANSAHRRAKSSLVELVVGDDTRSGFGITVWLDNTPPGGLPPRPPSMASLLSTLHPQDIILVQNLALNTFNGKVYGSTLRQNMTQMHVLYRQKHSREEQAAHNGDEGVFSTAHLAAAKAVVAASANGAQAQQSMAPGWRLAAKASCVRGWALQYVFAGNKNHSSGGPTAVGNIWIQPPADTQ